MGRIYGGIEEAELQILIRETMQDLLNQRDDAIQALSERLDKVDERTRQGLASSDDRLEAIVQQLHQKVESDLSSAQTVTQSKFDGVEYRFSAADDRITTLTQRAGQLGKDIERTNDENRETNERLDDLSHRFQHKADSTYVDVRVAELRTQVQRKAEVEEIDHSLEELRQGMGECRKKFVEKDEQVHMMLQQLAAKVETAAVNAVIEDLQQKSIEWQAGAMNAAKDLEKLRSDIRRVEENMSIRAKSLEQQQIGLENRFNSLGHQAVTKAGGLGAMHASTAGGLGASDDSSRTQIVSPSPQQMPVLAQTQIVQISDVISSWQGAHPENGGASSEVAPQVLAAPMLPPAALSPHGSTQQIDTACAENGSHLSMPGSMPGRSSLTSSAGSYAPSPGGPQNPIRVNPILQQPAGSQKALLSSGSGLLPQAEPEASQAAQIRARGFTFGAEAKVQQVQSPAQIVRSQSAPGLRAQPLMGTSTVSTTPAQASFPMSPASSATTTPRVPGTSSMPLASLLWPPLVGKQAQTEGKGHGRGSLSYTPGLRPAPAPFTAPSTFGDAMVRSTGALQRLAPAPF